VEILRTVDPIEQPLWIGVAHEVLV
jgi:hypothetical protein